MTPQEDSVPPAGPVPPAPNGGPKSLPQIASRAWEHPADRAALQSLRAIPVFDEVLRKLFHLFGEKPLRLAFLANAVEVSPRQFSSLHTLFQEVLETLDAPRDTPLFVSQTPIVNAGAYGMDRPFVILNSGMLHLLDREELRFVMAHEVGHILSGHVLYRTMMALLLQLAERGFPLVGMAARAVLLGLLEWYRRSELSSDRAGLLGVQNPEVAFHTMLRLAGGGPREENNLDAFLAQADTYRETTDLADAVFKILNLMGSTHPFYVLRVSELRSWIESGAYDRIIRGEYLRRDEPEPDFMDDLKSARQAYTRDMGDLMDEIGTAARSMRDSIMEAFRTSGPGAGGPGAPGL
ncbi:MAG: M48 family metallopeptidase [Gemmatimonadota bacterium]